MSEQHFRTKGPRQLWKTAMGTMDIATIHDYFDQVPDKAAYNKETEDCGENLA